MSSLADLWYTGRDNAIIVVGAEKKYVERGGDLELGWYFTDFLAAIRPQPSHIDDFRTGHRTLRERLVADQSLKPIIVTTFLQGSYRRATAIRPSGDKRADVDVVVVTRLNEDEYMPKAALDVFVPFLDKYYPGKWERQGRSLGIKLSYVELDLVVTSTPCEAEVGALQSDSVTGDDTIEEVTDWRLVKSWVSPSKRSLYSVRSLLEKASKEAEWQLSPLHIPDRDAGIWEDTHPIAQIHWTWDKNRACNGHYINVVKALKWWRRVNHSTPKYPKGYPVEHLIGMCCPNGITSVAQGVTFTLEAIVRDYEEVASCKAQPCLPDHGVPSHNVFARISGTDFAEFYEQVCSAAQVARRAFDEESESQSAKAWQVLFGDRFPDAPDEGDGGNAPVKGNFTPRTEQSRLGGGRFA